MQLQETNGVRIAIEGCGHGTLHAIYASVTEACSHLGWPGVDLLIIAGDFQSVRNAYDLNCVSMPAKYRHMGDFHEYYSGQRLAPYLTIFIGGNHEASNYLFELYFGGWAAPNIYYMGAANVIRFGPLRIASLSGIWKGFDYRKAHYERLPYNESEMKSIYHVRELDARRLLQIRTQVDVGISHDWPNGVEWKGNWKQLFRFKQHLEEDARSKRLGSIAASEVMDHLRPRRWYSAHLHCRYEAIVEYDAPKVSQLLLSESTNGNALKNDEEIDMNLDDEDVGVAQSSTAAPNPNEIALDDDENDDDGEMPGTDITSTEGPPSNSPTKPVPPPSAEQTTLSEEQVRAEEQARAALPTAFRRALPPPKREHPVEITNTQVKFLALDKCVEGKKFLQLEEIPVEGEVEIVRPLQLMYDREWLAITRSFVVDDGFEVGHEERKKPREARPPKEYDEMNDNHRIWVDNHISNADLVIPENFEVTAPVYDSGDWNLPQYHQAREYPNPQTSQFCRLLDIQNPFELSEDEIDQRMKQGPKPDPQGYRSHHSQRQRGGGGRGRGWGGSRGGGRGGGRGRGRGRSHGYFRAG